MTDYSGLVERMRAYPANKLCIQIANALEAQAKRIATLEAALKETLVIAERNELGEYQLRARAALNGEKNG